MDNENAINFQQKAFDVFCKIEKYADTEYLGQICTTLSELQDKAGLSNEALNSLRMVERIYQNCHGGDVSQKTCKVKRNISLLCLKLDENDAALDELK